MKKSFKAISLLFVFFLFIFSLTGCIQKDYKEIYSENFQDATDINNMEDIINELASEPYQGRLPGTEGNHKTVNYIIDEFSKYGLKSPSNLENYQQVFSHKVRVVNKTPKLEIVDSEGNIIKSYRYIEDFTVLTLWNSVRLKGDVTATTYDVEYRQYERDEIEGKFGLMSIETREEIPNYETMARGLIDASLGGGAYGVIMERKLNSDDYFYPRFVASSKVLNTTSENNEGPMVYYVSKYAYSEIKELTSNGAFIHASIDFSIEEVESSNVIGYIPGSDKKLKDEYIVISGHLDHVGSNGETSYNPGALDNASGIAGLLEIARVISEAEIKPKKTIVFIAFNGEEEGLLGSEYYVDNPVFPLDRTTVINLDMIGSISLVPLEIRNTSSTKREINEIMIQLASEIKIHTKEVNYGGSDHFPFNNKDVTAITLIHYDMYRYHSPLDTIDNVNFHRLKQVTNLVLYYIAYTAF